jgi:HD-like signal output (HDOD) protein
MLRQFASLEGLSDQQLELLAQSLFIHQAGKGERLVRRGDEEPFSLLLLAGTVELVAMDGARKRIQAGRPEAATPIAQLMPRRYDVTATAPVAFLKLDPGLQEELRETSKQLQQDSALSVFHSPSGIDFQHGFALADEELLTERIRDDLNRGRMVLPSLPETALRIGRALNDERASAERIARLIQADPAMTAKVVRAANSALYGGRQPVDSCTAAVVRLGTTTTHKLVLSFALREVFRAESGAIRRAMEDLWRHSTRVAAICYVLARLTRRFDAEHALLAGLVHDIGKVALLSYADQMPELARDPLQLARTMATLRGSLGAAILERWDFAEDVIVAARDAEHWTRNPGPDADYCDLVIIAQLHSYVGTPRMQELPHLGQLPCFTKLELGELTPRLSIKILEKADDTLRAVERMLGS